MSIRKSIPLAVALSCIAVGCGNASIEVKVGGNGEKPAPDRTAAAKLPRVVALTAAAGAECPAPKGPGWTVKRLFPAGVRLPRSLSDLCVYDPVAGAAKPALASDLPRNELVGAVEDPPMVVAQAEPDAAATKTLMLRRAALFEQADGNGLVAPKAGWLPVFMGFPDTSPAWSGATPGRAPSFGPGQEWAKSPYNIALGSLDHGFNVAWAAEALTCAAKDDSVEQCAGRARTVLALGGRGGTATRTDFAVGVFSLLHDWVQGVAPDASGKPWVPKAKAAPLVVNLAAGWEPRFDCLGSSLPKPDDVGADLHELKQRPDLAYPQVACGNKQQQPMSAGAAAVYGVLVYASCQGALVIASAGNDMGYAGAASGPILPAAWEKQAAPSAEDCEAWFGDIVRRPTVAAPATTYRPLVHAVGAVTEADVPIMVSRPGGMPRLAAPGARLLGFPATPMLAGYAPICDSTGRVCDRSRPMTGTSISAAVVTAAAALVWAQRPDLAPETVMQTIWEAGVDLGYPAEFSGGDLGPGARNVHRVSLCRAVGHACFSDFMGLGGAPGLPGGDVSHCPEARPVCPTPRAYAGGTRPALDGSRSDEGRAPLPGSLALVFGQPGVGVCPACTVEVGPAALDAAGNPISWGWVLSGASVLSRTFWIDSGATGLTSPFLEIFDSSSNRLFAGSIAAFNSGLWSPTTSQQVSGRNDPSAPLSRQPASAVLRWVDNSGVPYQQDVALSFVR